MLMHSMALHTFLYVSSLQILSKNIGSRNFASLNTPRLSKGNNFSSLSMINELTFMVVSKHASIELR